MARRGQVALIAHREIEPYKYNHRMPWRAKPIRLRRRLAAAMSRRRLARGDALPRRPSIFMARNKKLIGHYKSGSSRVIVIGHRNISFFDSLASAARLPSLSACAIVVARGGRCGSESRACASSAFSPICRKSENRRCRAPLPLARNRGKKWAARRGMLPKNPSLWS